MYRVVGRDPKTGNTGSKDCQNMLEALEYADELHLAGCEVLEFEQPLPSDVPSVSAA